MLPADTLPEGTNQILDEDGIDETDAAQDMPQDISPEDLEDAVMEAEVVELEDGRPESATPEPASSEPLAVISDPTEEPAVKQADTPETEATPGEGLRGALFDKIDEFKGQATDRTFAFAQAGKDRATGLLDDVVRMIEDAAAEIDAKIGTQYGDYARRAADGVTGVADSVKAKGVDELFDDARGLINKSPAIAIGAAAALGFVVTRLARAGVPTPAPEHDDDATSR